MTTVEPPAPSPRRPAWYLILGSVLVIAAAAGLAAFGGFARHSFTVGPVRISASAAPSLKPATTVALPPFGSIRAATHIVPLSLRVSLDEVDVRGLERFVIDRMAEDAMAESVVADVRGGFRRAAMKGLLAALIAGAFVGWSLRRSLRSTLASALVAVLVPAALVFATSATLDLDAFHAPTFRGAVSYAPALIDLVESRAERVGPLRDQVRKLAGDLARYYDSPQSFASAGALEGTYRVLHVSDLHLDPVGLELAHELAQEFKASLVIDTGDINYLGSRVEAAAVASEIPTSVPQLFVPGNHDSPAVIAALEALPNVTILRTESVEFDGFVVFGVPDPVSRGNGYEADSAQVAATAEAAAGTLARALASGSPTPTIVAVHNPEMAKRFEGLAPLVLAGHSHMPLLERRKHSWYLNSGTTGGIDFTAGRAEPHIPHSASVLYYTAELPRRLVAIDQIAVFGLAGESSLKRTVIDETLLR